MSQPIKYKIIINTSVFIQKLDLSISLPPVNGKDYVDVSFLSYLIPHLLLQTLLGLKHKKGGRKRKRNILDKQHMLPSHLLIQVMLKHVSLSCGFPQFLGGIRVPLSVGAFKYLAMHSLSLVLPLFSPGFQVICPSKAHSVGVPTTSHVILLGKNQSYGLRFSPIWATSGSQK